MKVGDIIRKKVASGTPVGPYMRIEVIDDDKVYASVFGSDAPNIMILKQNVHLCETRSLVISPKMLEDLKNGFKRAISHKCTPTWKAVADNKPEIIIFRTAYVVYKHPFVLEEGHIIYSSAFKEMQVHLYVRKLEYA